MAPSEQVACQESLPSYLLKWAFFRSLAADQIRALHVLCKDFPIIRSKTSICQLLREPNFLRTWRTGCEQLPCRSCL